MIELSCKWALLYKSGQVVGMNGFVSGLDFQFRRSSLLRFGTMSSFLGLFSQMFSASHLLPCGISSTSLLNMNSWIEGDKHNGKPRGINIRTSEQKFCFCCFDSQVSLTFDHGHRLKLTLTNFISRFICPWINHYITLLSIFSTVWEK